MSDAISEPQLPAPIGRPNAQGARLQRLRDDLSQSILMRRITLVGYIAVIPPLRYIGVGLSDTIILMVVLWFASTFALRALAYRQTSERAFQRVHLGHMLWETVLMLVVVHNVGTITWAGVFFPIFTIYYACSLLPRAGAALVSTVVIVGMCLMAMAEAAGVWPHVELFTPEETDFRNPIYVLATLTLTVIGGYGMMGLTFERFARIQGNTARSESERRAHTQALMMAVEALRSGHDSQSILHAIARAALAAVDGDRGAIWLADEPAGVVRRVAQATAPGRADNVGVDVLPLQHPFVQSILRDGAVAVIEEAAGGASRELAAAFNSRSILVVPFVRNGQVEGALTISSMDEVRNWGTEEITTVSALAAQGALALERTEMEAATVEADRLRQLNRMRDDFLRGVGHELKTPLTVVNGYLELLSRRADSLTPERRHAMLEEARANVRQITTLFDDLSDLVDADEGNLGLQLKPMDLAEPLRTLVAGFHTLDGGERINSIIPPSLPDVMADEVRVRQVVGNLLTNALRYAPKGDILLCAEARNGHVAIGVQDHGAGISKEFRERIWERYYRAPGASDMSSRGTGIGLALVRTLVEAHDGRVDLDTGPQGSTFTVLLPITK